MSSPSNQHKLLLALTASHTRCEECLCFEARHHRGQVYDIFADGQYACSQRYSAFETLNKQARAQNGYCIVYVTMQAAQSTVSLV